MKATEIISNAGMLISVRGILQIHPCSEAEGLMSCDAAGRHRHSPGPEWFHNRGAH